MVEECLIIKFAFIGETLEEFIEENFANKIDE